MNSKKVLFIDDEVNVLEGLKRLFHQGSPSWNMSYAENAGEALELLEKGHFDIIVADYKMPDMDGIRLLEQVKQLYPEVKRILLTGQSEEEVFERSKSIADEYVTKPCSKEELIAVLEKCR